MGLRDIFYCFRILAGQKAAWQGRIPLSRLLLRILANRAFPGIGSRKAIDVLGLRVEFLDRATFWGLVWEIYIHRVYDVELPTQAPFIIDCGSNIGLSALYFKMKYRAAEIIAFEPDAQAFGKLKSNIEANDLKGVVLHNAAVSDREGKAVLFSDRERRTSVGMSLTKRLTGKGLDPVGDEVETVLLSQYINRQVDLLKIDVEGVELRVIRELRDHNKLQMVNNIIIEFHRDRGNAENRLGAMLYLLEKAGFETILDSHSPPPYDTWKLQQLNSLMVYAYRS